MSSKAGKQIPTTGSTFLVFLMALAVLKLTAIVDRSWWRVMLPFWVFLDHNAAYMMVGFICPILRKIWRRGGVVHWRDQFQMGLPLPSILFFLFVDNLLRWIDRRKRSFELVLLCPGKLEILVFDEVKATREMNSAWLASSQDDARLFDPASLMRIAARSENLVPTEVVWSSHPAEGH